MAWSPDGKYLASGTSNGSVSLWEFPGTGLVRTVKVRDRYPIKALAWSPGSDALAVTNMGCTEVRRFDVPSGKMGPALEGLKGVAVSLAWSPDGKMLAGMPARPAVGCWSGMARRESRGTSWARRVNPSRQSPGRPMARSWFMAGPQGQWNCAWLPAGPPWAPSTPAPSMPSPFLTTASSWPTAARARRMRVWKTDTLENLQVLRPGLTYVLAWSPDGRLLATNGPSGRVQLWQKENGQRLAVCCPGPTAADWRSRRAVSQPCRKSADLFTFQTQVEPKILTLGRITPGTTAGKTTRLRSGCGASEIRREVFAVFLPSPLGREDKSAACGLAWGRGGTRPPSTTLSRKRRIIPLPQAERVKGSVSFMAFRSA